jgi:hypothetical protein
MNTKRDKTKALIEYYRSMNPEFVGDWQAIRQITKDLNDYLDSLSYDESSYERTAKQYECDELYNETY